jgi:hypothetical protein
MTTEGGTMESKDHRMTLFADSTGVPNQPDPISVSCDASLDEVDAVLRLDFRAGLGSSGEEYAIMVSSDEVRALMAAIDVCADGGGNEDYAESLACVGARLQRVDGYLPPLPPASEQEDDFCILDLQAAEPDQLTFGQDVRVEVHSTTDAMGLNRVDLIGTRGALIDYVREHWGEEDADWYRGTIASMFKVGRA